MKQGSSGLTVREVQAYHKPIIEQSPRKVAQWVNELPIANLGESSKAIYHQLVDTNQSLLDADKRMAIITKIFPVADALIQALEKQFLNRHIALNDKQKKIAALVQAIQTELSLGCHAVIEAIVESEVKWSNKKNLAQSISLAMKYHGLVILRCYQLYSSVPSRLWKELYTLYSLAKSYELDGTAIEVDDVKNMTCLKLFKCTLLLSISNPYQLRQNEIGELWALLPSIVDAASLESHAYNKNHFVVAINSGGPPIHKSLFSDSVTNHLKLGVSSVVEQLKTKLVSETERGQIGARRTMLFKHLIQLWSQGTHRSFARTPTDEDLNISIGLGATHYLLMQEPGAGDEDISGAEDTLAAMEGSLKHATLLDVAQRENKNLKQDFDYLSSKVASQDIWAKLYRPNQAAEKEDTVQAKNRSRDTIVKENYQMQKADLINMSPGGYCIQVSSVSLPKHAQTGEILGFLENNHWSIGVVRWVRRQVKGGVVQMGIQLLAPGALPINAQLRNSHSEKNEFQRALLLPALMGIGQPKTIVTNPLSFSTNSKVRISDHGNEYDVKLGKEITSTGSFRQFQFERVGGNDVDKKPTRRSNDPLLDGPDMEGVWDLI